MAAFGREIIGSASTFCVAFLTKWSFQSFLQQYCGCYPWYCIFALVIGNVVDLQQYNTTK
jgi:hypothetical protein